MSFLTCFWLFPQKEHFNRSPPSPNFATERPRSPDRTADADLARALGHRNRREFPVGQDLVDDAVVLGFLTAHDEVAVRVLAHAVDALTGVEREDLVEELTHPHDFLGLDS